MELRLIIRDNGIGIDQDDINNQKSFGLMGMRERARSFGGEVKIRGEKGVGTTVSVRIPLVIQPDDTKLMTGESLMTTDSNINKIISQ